MASKYADEVPEIIRTFHSNEVETLHIYPMDGGIFISKEDLDNTVGSSPQRAKVKAPAFEGKSFLIVLSIFILFLLLDSIDAYFAMPTAFVYITPKSITTSLSKSIRPEDIFAHRFPLLTLSETKTVTASGKGHQNASYSLGLITFYNGLLTAQSVPQSTILTGSDGIEVETVSALSIPSATPPIEGSASVQARAIKVGSSGNINTRDIDFQYSTGVLALNLSSFSGGRDQRDYSFVTKKDIESTSSFLSSDLARKANNVFSSQVKKGDVLVALPCISSAISNHNIGDEASNVSVSVSEKCIALSYNPRNLQSIYPIPSSYQGKLIVRVISASLSKFDVSIEGVLVAKINEARILKLIEGRSKADALRVLSSLPSVGRAAISGVETLPLDAGNIRIVVLVPNL